MESSVATCTVLYSMSPILLTFNILPLFLWKPCIKSDWLFIKVFWDWILSLGKCFLMLRRIVEYWNIRNYLHNNTASQKFKSSATSGLWKTYLSDGIQCCHLYYFIQHESYIIDIQPPTTFLWKPCIKSDWLFIKVFWVWILSLRERFLMLRRIVEY